jgi:PAS domain S-box-containing protein
MFDMKNEPSAIPILAPESIRRRRRLSLTAFLLGLGAVILSLFVVWFSQLHNREEIDQGYLDRTRNEVDLLSYAIDSAGKTDDDTLLNKLCDQWRQLGHWSHDPDEHFIVVNNADAEVMLDTVYRGLAHRPTPSPELRQLRQIVIAVAQQKALRRVFTDKFQSETGEVLLGTFRDTAYPTQQKYGRNWLLGIFRSQAGLHAAKSQSSVFGTLIVMCGLAMPVSLLLMYYTYHLAQRDQVLAEQARARLAAIVQDSEDAIFAQTFDGLITSWNRGAERLFGYSEQEAVGRPSAELIPSERTLEEQILIDQIGRGEPAEDQTVETIRTRKNGSAVHLAQTISPVKDDGGRDVGVSIIARDITERRNLEREVLESGGREQQRIGRELHDSLGQELTGLSYLAKSLQQKLTAADNPHAETAQTIASGIQQALRGVRSAVQGLVPVEVDASGFMVALEKLVAQTQAHCGIDCRIDSREPVEIDDNVLATNLYRIVQEAINNAVKHARASQIVVRPQTHHGTLSVTVEDDGVGIAEHSRQNGGMGLRIMQYRAGVIDAALDVHLTKSGGTAVVCFVKNYRGRLDT